MDELTTNYTVDLNASLTQILSDGTNTYLYGVTRIAQQNGTDSLRVEVDNRYPVIMQLFLNAGYRAVRYHWRMEIELLHPPALPSLPEGVILHPFVWQEHAQAVWQARNAAFRANWGNRVMRFEEFRYHTYENVEYDPGLWQVAWQGFVSPACAWRLAGHISWGYSRVARERSGDIFTPVLLCCILCTTNHNHRVGVDAADENDATALYHRAGMHTISEYAAFEKILHPVK